MDMETIESLQIGVEKYPGTVVFVSHDREFVGGVANRIIEVQQGGKLWWTSRGLMTNTCARRA